MKRHSAKGCFHSCVSLLGDAWTLLIVKALSRGECRFNELQRKVVGISPVTLTDRLKKLQSHDVVDRKSATQDKLSVTYTLTSKGSRMMPVLKAIQRYADKYFG